jgi:radical SAM superfamily enzyme YgiQ (UPF0313 family)/Fe-S-cluster containining protein
MERDVKVALVSCMTAADALIPIGLLTLAKIARNEGIRDIRVLDLPRRDEEEDFIRSIRDCDVVGLSSICSTYVQTVRISKEVKSASPKTIVVLGGPQASLAAEESLSAFPFVDVVFQGEAEHSWREFLCRLKEPTRAFADVPGIVWRENGAIRRSAPAPIVEDLGTLPYPALDLYHVSRRMTVIPIEIGRGCPFDCSFCSTSPHFRRKFRIKPVTRILEEMDLLYDRWPAPHFYFVQDSFSVRRAFVEELCAALRRHHRPCTWYCSARTDQMSDDLVATMKDAGCRGIYFGLETGSQRMQKIIRKNLDVRKAVTVINQTAAQGLEVTASMIVGFPDETPADLSDTLDVYLELKASGDALVQLHVLAPMLGSPLSREGHALRYDAMPSDFSDGTCVLDDGDRALLQQHADIFASFWHYTNPSIPRARFLFLAHFLGLASLYLPSELRRAAQEHRAALRDRLLHGEIPAPFYSDPTFPAGLDRWVTLTREILDEFLATRASSVDAARTIDEVCASCGECCFESAGILCGRDEWPGIRSFLTDAEATAIEGSDLLVVHEQAPVSYVGNDGRLRARSACPALRYEEQRWRCAIEGVKPAGCIAYPLKLVLRELPEQKTRWLISLEFEASAPSEGCPLNERLRTSPELLERYRDYVRERIGAREGAFALAAYNRLRALQAGAAA